MCLHPGGNVPRNEAQSSHQQRNQQAIVDLAPIRGANGTVNALTGVDPAARTVVPCCGTMCPSSVRAAMFQLPTCCPDANQSHRALVLGRPPDSGCQRSINQGFAPQHPRACPVLPMTDHHAMPCRTTYHPVDEDESSSLSMSDQWDFIDPSEVDPVLFQCSQHRLSPSTSFDLGLGLIHHSTAKVNMDTCGSPNIVNDKVYGYSQANLDQQLSYSPAVSRVRGFRLPTTCSPTVDMCGRSTAGASPVRSVFCMHPAVQVSDSPFSLLPSFDDGPYPFGPAVPGRSPQAFGTMDTGASRSYATSFSGQGLPELAEDAATLDGSLFSPASTFAMFPTEHLQQDWLAVAPKDIAPSPSFGLDFLLFPPLESSPTEGVSPNLRFATKSLPVPERCFTPSTLRHALQQTATKASIKPICPAKPAASSIASKSDYTKHRTSSKARRNNNSGTINKTHRVNKPRRFTCKHCPFGAVLEKDLQRHDFAVHQRGSYKCPFCDVSLSRIDGLLRHIKNKSLHTEMRRQGADPEGLYREIKFAEAAALDTSL